jgi:hypothetical protein
MTTDATINQITTDPLSDFHRLELDLQPGVAQYVLLDGKLVYFVLKSGGDVPRIQINTTDSLEHFAVGCVDAGRRVKEESAT